MSLPKIPDDTFENRCRYCLHFVEGKENREIKDSEVYRPLDNPCPCHVQSIARYCYQVKLPDGRYENLPYSDGECRSFAPVFGYPICRDCEYFNCFMEEREYCTKSIPLENRKIAALGNTYGQERYSRNFYVCDKWKLKGHWKDSAIKSVAEGRLPRAFDPDTLKLLGPVAGIALEKWQSIENELRKELIKEAEEKALKVDDDGQIKIL